MAMKLSDRFRVCQKLIDSLSEKHANFAGILVFKMRNTGEDDDDNWFVKVVNVEKTVPVCPADSDLDNEGITLNQTLILLEKNLKEILKEQEPVAVSGVYDPKEDTVQVNGVKYKRIHEED